MKQILENVIEKQFDLGTDRLNNEELVKSFLLCVTPEQNLEENVAKFWSQVGEMGMYRLLTNTEINDLFCDARLSMGFAAAVELGRRIQRDPQEFLGKVMGSRQIGLKMVGQYQKTNQEQLTLLSLDTKNKIKLQKVIFQGGLNSAAVHPREVMHENIRVSANSFILVHNHPSGDETPSDNDIRFTKRMFEVGKLMGIDLLDHIIIGDQSYWSAAESNII
ncbi:JAB domain-containing protein [Pediococcus argentinicus]|uniref:MPN domain-containing protein n=1 Tax=Pediococcus argentinicus TaxID=480391 RepID=A0A0R2N5R1_9LACO|nr:DNA repair protein RadC [Pediococcus argentinicus]KRO21025.1 hypothetical protein IV88_GL001467 [Pediococcus argentinicus]NKZ23150.1 DNA repair protein RadC [Pediococcus argentinicus]GEP20328.1 UPF0758 protein [Pediococcus argentinicus]